MRIKNILGEKSHLFAYLRFCAFAACEEKRIEKSRYPHNVDVLNTDIVTTRLM